ncbi:hypothetical protein SSX86_020155 [Deinandra increscens subsp. villosa]|uniref:RING-CH-type domain-containing protein n=1 Tax=Deinandra increscens subsp. villosa TaxID=3103831 RepID=A0AAP0CU95_9ASTR
MSGEIELEESGFGNPSGMDHLLQNHRNAAGYRSPALAFVSAPSYGQMKYEDVESGAMAICRICLEGDGEEDDDLISPCMCKGTQQFVHRACLDHWRSVKEGFAFSHCSTCKAQFHLKVVKLNAISWPKIKFRLFVARDVFLVFLALQMVIGLLGGLAYTFDKDGSFRSSYSINSINWEPILLTHPISFYYCIGVLFFFVVVGFFGLVIHCISCNNDPRVAGCQNFCFGCGILDCFPTSVEVCVVLTIILVVIFFLLGIAYGFLAATMAIQRIWQRHYHILTKRELTQEYVVEDLNGFYTPPELAPEHVDRLNMLKLM